jgi:hypothetical protein
MLADTEIAPEPAFSGFGDRRQIIPGFGAAVGSGSAISEFSAKMHEVGRA